MRSATVLKVSALAVVVGALWPADAEARRFATLRCSPGYSVTVTYTLTEGGVPIRTLTQSCTPQQPVNRREVPADYDDLSVATGGIVITAPDGTTTTSPPDNAPFENMPWGDHPRCPHKYICNANGCVADPLAPPFLQDGEVLLGDFDEGTDYGLTVKVIEAVTRAPIVGASVTALNSEDDSAAGSGLSGSTGRILLMLAAGGDYYLRVESPNHFTQVSDDFQLLGEHMWTVVLSAGGTPPGDGYSIPLWLMLLLILIILVLAVLLWRQRAP